MLLLHSRPPLHLPLRRRHHLLSTLPPQPLISAFGQSTCIFCSRGTGRNGPPRTTKAKKKENVWSVDNELAAREGAAKQASSSGGDGRQRRRRRRRQGRSVRATGLGTGRVLVSGAMLMEIETVLQTQVGALSLGLVFCKGKMYTYYGCRLVVASRWQIVEQAKLSLYCNLNCDFPFG